MTTFFVLIIYVLLDDNNMYIRITEDELDKLFYQDLNWIKEKDLCFAPKKLVDELIKIHDETFYEIECIDIFLKKSIGFFRNYIINDENCDYNYRLNSKKIRAFFPNNNSKKVTYSNYILAFKKAGIVLKTDNYSTKFKVSNKYKFNKSFFEDEFVIVTFSAEELDSYNIKCTNLDLESKYLNTLQTLKLDIENAIKEQYQLFKCELDKKRFFCRINKILKFNRERNRYCIKGKKSNRIYHALCFLPKECRKHLNVSFNVLDIVNCQPLLLCYYLKNNDLQYDNSFLDDVQNGCFYETIQNAINNLNIKITRDEVKKEIYSQILFDFKTHEKYLVNKVFKDIYPNTYESLMGIHLDIEQTNITLASILQNLESELFNNLKVQNSEYYFTLFDAIYFNDKIDDLDLRTQIDDYFKKLNLRVNVSDK